MSAHYDRDADILYVRVTEGMPVARSKALDDLRLIDYSEDGTVLGIEFIDASFGVDLRDVPYPEHVKSSIANAGLDLPICI